MLKSTVFHVLMSFRGIFFAIFQLLSGFFLLGSIAILIMGYISGVHRYYSLVFALLVFIGINVLKHSYDRIILACKPDDLDITLFS